MPHPHGLPCCAERACVCGGSDRPPVLRLGLAPRLQPRCTHLSGAERQQQRASVNQSACRGAGAVVGGIITVICARHHRLLNNTAGQLKFQATATSTENNRECLSLKTVPALRRRRRRSGHSWERPWGRLQLTPSIYSSATLTGFSCFFYNIFVLQQEK